MKPQFLGIALVTLLISPSAAQSPAPDRLQRILDSGTLRVGTTMDTPVFSMRTSSGQLEGFDMDALATLAPALGVKIDYVKMTFGSMLGDLAADKFDIAMSGMGRTLDRARTATFSKPYMRYHREDQILLNYLNIWIDQIEMDGTLAKIRGKWLGDVR